MHYQEAYKYYSKYYELLKKSGDLDPNDMQRMGYVLWEIGKKDEARYYFNELIRLCKESIRLKNTYARQVAHYDLAGVYTFLGDKELAYKHLEEFAKTNSQILYIIVMLKQQDPLFDSIREEERFQEILQNMEAKYQAEHERVRKWMEEQGDLPG
jgi:tetratricopeptide (TPR) repeat protein